MRTTTLSAFTPAPPAAVWAALTGRRGPQHDSRGQRDAEDAGAADVVQMPGQRVRGPDRQPVRKHDRLDVRAEGAVLSGR